jgi:hypothetical protein
VDLFYTTELHTTEGFHVVFEIFCFELQAELENLSTRLEECSLQYPAEKPHNAQICTANVAMVTDADKQQGVQNTTTISSTVIQKAVVWFHSGEVTIEYNCILYQPFTTLGIATDLFHFEAGCCSFHHDTKAPDSLCIYKFWTHPFARPIFMALPD